MGDDGSVNTSIGDLQGLASSFGINIGSGGNTSFYIPDIIQSRKLRKAIVRNKWDTTYDPNPIDLISLWGINKKEGFSINNIFNKDYVLIQNYPMPGKTWQINLSKIVK